MRKLALSLALALSLSVTSCSLVPEPPKAETPVEVAAVTAATVEGVAEGVLEAFQAGRITRRQAEWAYDQLNEAISYLRLAEVAFAAGDEAGGSGSDAQARAILLAVERLLSEAVDNG